MDSIQDYLTALDQTFYGITLGRLSLALLVLFLALILKKVLAHIFTRTLFAAAKKTAGELDDLLLKYMRKPAEFLVLIAGLYLAVNILQLPEKPVDLDEAARSVLTILFTFNLTWFLYNLVGILDSWLGHWAGQTESTLDDHLLPFIRKTLRVFIVLMAVLMMVQNLGYSISGLLASLGIGGLAVALAAKDSLSNIFGSIMILLDRPFQIGDWVKAGDMEGTVEEIGFRSTRIRTFEKTLITIPNSQLTNLAIDNISRRPKRRIKMNIGITYATSPAQMRKAIDLIRAMLKQHPAIDQEFFLVNFTDFGASSLDILVYCFTTTTDWQEYLEARQDVSLKIMDILEDMGLEIAFPSRSIYLENNAQMHLPESHFLPSEQPGTGN